ncbi:Hypothetical predicted protein, partial [Pelobates cultripes]
ETQRAKISHFRVTHAILLLTTVETSSGKIYYVSHQALEFAVHHFRATYATPERSGSGSAHWIEIMTVRLLITIWIVSRRIDTSEEAQTRGKRVKWGLEALF